MARMIKRNAVYHFRTKKKLKKYSDKEYIRTVRGVGYKFEIPEA